jgi:alpha-D-ribose 1-methylphosphonate 5-triphosphate diphosphatase
LQAVARYAVDYVVFNNHLPEALQMAQHHPQRFAVWAAQQGRSTQTLLNIVEQAMRCDDSVPQALAVLAETLKARGVVMGSHDDGDSATRSFYRNFGASVCEFPTTVEAAQSAHDAGEPVLMGAPNVVRGGSQSGNIAAEALIADGLCDCLVSDYYYPALSQAAWALEASGTLPFARAWEMVSTQPAKIMGLHDRGRLEHGLRADLVVMNPQTHAVEATIAGGRLAYAHGEVARRLVTSHVQMAS